MAETCHLRRQACVKLNSFLLSLIKLVNCGNTKEVILQKSDAALQKKPLRSVDVVTKAVF